MHANPCYAWQPLHAACLCGHQRVVKLLLEHGGDVSAGDPYTRTPLHIASQGGFLDLVRLLLDNGADLAEGDNQGSTAIHWACGQGHLQVVKLLLDYGENIHQRDISRSPLMRAAKDSDSISLVDFLIESGVDITETDEHGSSYVPPPTMDNIEVMRRFIALGSNVNRPLGFHGSTALNEAVRRRSTERVELLLAHGADPTIKDRNGMTPAMLAKNWKLRRLLEHAEIEWRRDKQT